MKARIAVRVLASVALAAALSAVTCGPASATGTVRIQQRDGATKTYSSVRIVVFNESMAITSSDGQGTLILGKAACTKVGELLRCIPYDATLEQHGEVTHIPLKYGTVWFNPSDDNQQLSYSSTQLPPRGVLLSIQTKAGTYVSLTGIVDRIQK
ncbi:MAG TPA: hypothetical protein VMG98_13545 [Verrucomicrobiae bacterium]|nr:hypothetical protein [Verrucomicrobiae bacterium]